MFINQTSEGEKNLCLLSWWGAFREIIDNNYANSHGCDWQPHKMWMYTQWVLLKIYVNLYINGFRLRVIIVKCLDWSHKTEGDCIWCSLTALAFEFSVGKRACLSPLFLITQHALCSYVQATSRSIALWTPKSQQYTKQRMNGFV